MLPSGYTEVTHIDGDGRAYIETSLQYIQGDIIELNGKFKNLTHDNGLVTMIPWNTPNPSRFMFAIADSGNTHSFTMAYNNLPGGSNNPNPKYYDTEFHKWRYEGLTLTIDDGLVTLTNTEDYKQGSGTLRLFHKYNGASEVSIKYYKHWRNGQLIANFVPCIRKSDNAVGMYDLATNSFFGNVGNGKFTAGDVVKSHPLRLLYMGGGSKIKGYTKIEYLQNTASQRIDTGILPSANQNYEIRFSLDTVGSNCAIFGGRNTQTNKTATLFFLTASKSFRFDRTSQINVSSGVVPHVDDIFKFEYNNGVATLTNETTGKSATTTMTGSYDLNSDYSIHLFCVNTTGNKELAFKGKIYEWKYSKDGEEIQHLVPVKRDSDNVVGMYDLKSKTFFGNSGSGSFTGGNPITEVGKKLYMVYTGYSPEGYRLFDYIQSSGTQYIDTSYAFQDDFSWEIDFEDFPQQTTLFGGRTSSTRTAILYNNPPACCPIAGSNGTATPFKFADLTTGRHKVKMSVASNKGSAWVDGVQTHNNVSFSGTYISGTTQAIFADNFGSSVAEHTRSKVYNLKMWQGLVPVRDFIPAQRLSDNAIGMYDKVTKTFFANKGSGTFATGNVVVSKKLRFIY